MNYGGSKKGKNDYLRSCSFCGRLVLRSSMVKKDGFLACKDDAPGRERLTLDKGNAANLKPRRWNPARDRLSDRDNEQDVYQGDEAVIFNIVQRYPTSVTVTNNGVGVQDTSDHRAMAYDALYLADLIQENKRPGVWISSARTALITVADALVASISISGSKSVSVIYGGIFATSPQLYDAETTGAGGLALLRAYQVLGDKRYLTAATLVPNFLRNAQCSNLLTTDFTSYDAAGTAPMYTGFFSHRWHTVGGRFDSQFYPGDLIALRFLRLLFSIIGDGIYGCDTVLGGFLTAIPQAPLSQMISDAALMWDNGQYDAGAGAIVNGFSPTAPREFFNAYPANKHDALYAAGTGSWAYSTGTQVTSLNWAKGIMSLYANEGLSSRILGLWNYMQGLTADPQFATPANTGDFVVSRATTGTFDATLCPPTSFDAATGKNASSVYDWSAWGLMSPIQSAKNVNQFLNGRVILGLKRPRQFDPGGAPPTDYIGYYGQSGLSYQTFASGGTFQTPLACMVANNYRQQPIIFPMMDHN